MTEVDQAGTLSSVFGASNGGIMGGEVNTEARVFLERVQRDFPKLRFRLGKKFTFRPPRTIIYESFLTGEDEPNYKILFRNYKMQVLHEVGHALLEHRFFATDVERLKMESDAWEEARKLSTRFNLEYDEEFIEVELDSYRDWLHAKSRCPDCGLTRYQTRDGCYHCPRCEL